VPISARPSATVGAGPRKIGLRGFRTGLRETQPVSGRSRSQISDIENSSSTDWRRNSRLRYETSDIPRQRPRYRRHDGGPDEKSPAVNLIYIRENGPLAVRAEIVINGNRIGYRATLCRCGASQNKPFCDGSHSNAGFSASGEPASIDTPALTTRDGPLEILPQRNGPLRVRGNLEICSGTGRTVKRTTGEALCRCGHSRSKPFCDGSHAGAGFIAD
jgi:CDGSH-type Zn-finger protein